MREHAAVRTTKPLATVMAAALALVCWSAACNAISGVDNLDFSGTAGATGGGAGGTGGTAGAGGSGGSGGSTQAGAGGGGAGEGGGAGGAGETEDELPARDHRGSACYQRRSAASGSRQASVAGVTKEARRSDIPRSPGTSGRSWPGVPLRTSARSRYWAGV